ncbi:hypothetical protein [Natronoglomus mannanivorans]|uniref:Uncharacterized protein n=1 Tax=Natronoglomus mannanivorans TaxID=2979990 RepID=A0AAP2YV86_9EURY|nr:hypothetical protein [Halobacteria archaeon AArc-xg1-1]
MTEVEDTDTGARDEEVCRAIHGRLTTDDRFESVTFEPSADRIRTVSARYDRSLFPADVQTARLDIRWYVGGNFSVHYIEDWTNEDQWECRWDRHPKEVGPAHFHPPPNAGRATAADFPSDYRDVLAIAIAYVAERIERLWNQQ